MTRSATEVMQDIISSAVLDSIDALKGASKGMPNTLLRDLNAIHANTAFADLPKDLQAAISASVRAAFTRLLKEGYAVAPAGSAPQRTPVVRREPREARGPRDPARGPREPRVLRPPRGPGKPPSGGPRSRTPKPPR